ncbi:MAG: ATP-binding cassette domain-containing protein [Deinococcales bacterium]
MQPDAGSVSIDGKDILSQTTEARAVIGYLPENAPLYPELTVQDHLLLVADTRKIPARDRLRAIREAVEATALMPKLTSPIGQLSKGYRQRVGLAQAILHKPKLLILDEPTVGLDPTQLIEIRGLIRRLAEHSTVLFSTHILSEVESLCNRAIILMNGHVRSDASLAELSRSDQVVVSFQSEPAGVLAALEVLPHVRVQRLAGDKPSYRLSSEGDSGALSHEVFKLAKQYDWPLRELRLESRTLESVFNELTARPFEPVVTPSEVEAEVVGSF